MRNCTVIPVFNGLSDRDVWLLTISTSHELKTVRKIKKYMVPDFLSNLSYETWDIAFISNDVNIMFNFLLNTHTRTFYSSFPVKESKNRSNNNNWITLGIKT
jgi:hypothetical protein